MKKWLTGLLMLGLLLLVPLAQAASGRHPAQVQFQQNINTVLNVVRTPGLSEAQKISRVEQYADRYLDYQRIAALAVGLPWRQFSPQQKNDFIAAFKEMIVSIYARSALMGAMDAKVNILPRVAESGQNRVDVFTEVRLKNGKKYEVAYQLYQSGNVYRVYNIKVDGASLVTIYRNQFNESIRQRGIDGTIAALREKRLSKVDALPAQK